MGAIFIQVVSGTFGSRNKGYVFKICISETDNKPLIHGSLLNSA